MSSALIGSAFTLLHPLTLCAYFSRISARNSVWSFIEAGAWLGRKGFGSLVYIRWNNNDTNRNGKTETKCMRQRRSETMAWLMIPGLIFMSQLRHVEGRTLALDVVH